MTPEPRTAVLDEVELSYHDLGPRDGAPVLLLHGFASSAAVNWFLTSWVTTLEALGRRVIAFDNRGHGGSTKFYRPADYGPDIFAADAVALLDHLEVERTDLIGYSMGARIAFAMAVWHPARVRRACLCGMGANMFGSGRDSESVARALETADPEGIDDPGAKRFRTFAERTGSDLRALAACIRPSETKLSAEQAGRIGVPVLVAVGGEDDVAGPAAPLAALIPGAKAFTVPGRDHMKSTGDPQIKDAVIRFLQA